MGPPRRTSASARWPATRQVSRCHWWEGEIRRLQLISESGGYEKAETKMGAVAECHWARNRLAEVDLECTARAIAACASALSPGLKLERPEDAAPKAVWTIAFVELADSRLRALQMLRKVTKEIVSCGPLLPTARVEFRASVPVCLCVPRGNEWGHGAP